MLGCALEVLQLEMPAQHLGRGGFVVLRPLPAKRSLGIRHRQEPVLETGVEAQQEPFKVRAQANQAQILTCCCMRVAPAPRILFDAVGIQENQSG